MINSQDIKMGTCIRMDGKLFFVIDFLHVKPGKGNTFMRVKLKNVVDGRVLERRFDISEKLEDVRVERRNGVNFPDELSIEIIKFEDHDGRPSITCKFCITEIGEIPIRLAISSATIAFGRFCSP